MGSECQLLLTVRDTYPVDGRGLIVVPTVPLSDAGVARRAAERVRLRLPGGAEREVEAVFSLPFVESRNGGATGLVCLLKGVSAHEVPPGSEVWVGAPRERK